MNLTVNPSEIINHIYEQMEYFDGTVPYQVGRIRGQISLAFTSGIIDQDTYRLMHREFEGWAKANLNAV